MSEHPKFAVFTYEQLKAAANEIYLKNHEMDETNRYILDESEIWEILCKWTKTVPTIKRKEVEP